MGKQTAFVTVRWVGLRRTQRHFDASAKKLMPKLGRQMGRAGEVLIGSAKKQFKGSRTRALYMMSGGKRKRRTTYRQRTQATGGRGRVKRGVTSPADRLGIFTGQYRKSITQTLKKRSRRRWSTEVGPEKIRYARSHELGINNMPKRPILEPAVKDTQEQIFRLIGMSFKVVT